MTEEREAPTAETNAAARAIKQDEAYLLRTTVDPETYLDKRVRQFTDWYNRKAAQAKKRYLAMRALSVVLGALVPVLVNVQFPYVSTVTTILSIIVVVLVSLENVYHYREQWKNYRSTEQFLQQERFSYQTRVGGYEGLDDGEAFRRFVERAESAIAAENAATLNTMTLTEPASTDDSAGQPGHTRVTTGSDQKTEPSDSQLRDS